MRELLDHGSPGWIRQSRKGCTQFIHNHMVVDFLSVSKCESCDSPVATYPVAHPPVAHICLPLANVGLGWPYRIQSHSHREPFPLNIRP
jgi:hypothetical protein